MNFATSAWPFSDANSAALLPALLSTSTSAPHQSNNLRCPCHDAVCNTVQPLLSAVCTVVPRQRRMKREMGMSRDNRRGNLGCRARQSHEETDLNCLARRALGGIARQTRKVPGAASDAIVGPAMPHGVVYKRGTNGGGIEYKLRR
jgi:hypothetical protein